MGNYDLFIRNLFKISKNEEEKKLPIKYKFYHILNISR